MNKILSLFLTLSLWTTAFAQGDPAPFIKGQTATGLGNQASTVFVPYKQSTKINAYQALIETGNPNILPDPGAESNATPWVAYADAAGVAPVDGTGGSPSVTVSNSTSSPLTGLKSLVFVKGASNLQGNGIAVPFTIPDSYKGKVIRGMFDYAVVSGTYADNDVSFWIYDVTNSVVIQPAPYLLKNTTINDKMVIEFQSSINSTSYRLIAHVASTSASAYTLKFDGFGLGTYDKSWGPNITNWVAFTPSMSFTGMSPNTAFWRQTGDSVEVIGAFAATTSAATYFFAGLPSGMSIDTTKLTLSNNTSAPGMLVGEMFENTASSAYGMIPLVTCPGTTVVGVCSGARSSVSTNLTPEPQANFFQSSTVFSYKYRVPIAGWSSTSVMSSEASTRVVSLIVGTSTTATTADTPIVFSGVFRDTHAGYNASTGRYTVPVPGFYQVQAYTDGTNAAGTLMYVSVNGNTSAGLNRPALGNSYTLNYPISGMGTVYVNAGDIIDIRPNGNIGTSGPGTSMSITRISGPAQIAASESVVAAYYISANFAAGTGTPINFDTKEIDSHNAVTPSATVWKFTAPVAGVYSVSTFGNIVGGSTGTFHLYKNGSIFHIMSYQASSSVYSGTQYLRLLAGDYIDLRPAGSQTITGGSLTSGLTGTISIHKIGNY